MKGRSPRSQGGNRGVGERLEASTIAHSHSNGPRSPQRHQQGQLPLAPDVDPVSGSLCDWLITFYDRWILREWNSVEIVSEDPSSQRLMSPNAEVTDVRDRLADPVIRTLPAINYGVSLTLVLRRSLRRKRFRHPRFMALALRRVAVDAADGTKKVRLFSLATSSAVCSSLPADRRLRRISVGGLP